MVEFSKNPHEGGAAVSEQGRCGEPYESLSALNFFVMHGEAAFYLHWLLSHLGGPA